MAWVSRYAMSSTQTHDLSDKLLWEFQVEASWSRRKYKIRDKRKKDRGNTFIPKEYQEFKNQLFVDSPQNTE